MKDNKTLKAIIRWLVLFTQGAAVGVGSILPGISGGVLCVAFGIYEPIMALLAHPFKTIRIYYKMLIPVLIGAVIGFVLLAGAVEYLFGASSFAALALFGGLICGTIPELIKKSEKSGPKQSWSAFIIPMAVVYVLLSSLGTDTLGSIAPSFLWYMFCGAMWGLGLVIPGLSPSSILIYMDLYQPMAAGIAALDFAVLIPLGIGLAATLLLTARLINYLFEKKYALVSRFVLGVMIASTLLIFPTHFPDIASVLLSIVCFAAGFALSRWMDIARKRYPSISQQSLIRHGE